MSPESVKVEISLEALIAALSGLRIEEKRRVMALLDEQLTDEEGGPDEEAAVAEAHAQVAAAEYVTLDDFIAGKCTP